MKNLTKILSVLFIVVMCSCSKKLDEGYVVVYYVGDKDRQISGTLASNPKTSSSSTSYTYGGNYVFNCNGIEEDIEGEIEFPAGAYNVTVYPGHYTVYIGSPRRGKAVGTVLAKVNQTVYFRITDEMLK